MCIGGTGDGAGWNIGYWGGYAGLPENEWHGTIFGYGSIDAILPAAYSSQSGDGGIIGSVGAKGSIAGFIRAGTRIDIDLIVMGTVCRTGIAGFLIGGTTETILHEVDCSVLAVKTKDFGSPVTR